MKGLRRNHELRPSFWVAPRLKSQTRRGGVTHQILDRSALKSQKKVSAHSWTPGEVRLSLSKVWSSDVNIAEALRPGQTYDSFYYSRQIDPKDLPQTPVSENLDTVIIVPLFDEPFSPHGELGRDESDEGVGVLELIGNLAAQVALEGGENPHESLEVFLFVNNSLKHAQKETKEYERNQNLLRMLNSLAHGKVPEDCVDEKTIQLCQDVIASDLKLSVVDKSSIGKCFYNGGVGVARDYSGLLASERIKQTGRQDGLLIWFDAENVLGDKQTLAKIQKRWREDHSAGVNTRKSLLRSILSPFDAEIQTLEYAQNYADYWGVTPFMIRLLQYKDDYDIDEDVDLMWGMNLISSLQAFHKVGGFHHITYMEDTFYVHALYFEYGLEGFLQCDDICIHNNYRASIRTDVHGGNGGDLYRLSQQKEMLYQSPFVEYTKRLIYKAIQSQIPYNELLSGQPQLAKIIDQNLYEMLTDLYRVYQAESHNFLILYRIRRLMDVVVTPAIKDMYPDHTSNEIDQVLVKYLYLFMGREKAEQEFEGLLQEFSEADKYFWKQLTVFCDFAEVIWKDFGESFTALNGNKRIASEDREIFIKEFWKLHKDDYQILWANLQGVYEDSLSGLWKNHFKENFQPKEDRFALIVLMAGYHAELVQKHDRETADYNLTLLFAKYFRNIEFQNLRTPVRAVAWFYKRMSERLNELFGFE